MKTQKRGTVHTEKNNNNHRPNHKYTTTQIHIEFRGEEHNLSQTKVII